MPQGRKPQRGLNPELQTLNPKHETPAWPGVAAQGPGASCFERKR